MQLVHKNDLDVMVENREKTLFQGKAWAITSVNEKGVFDILPDHSNFITLIKDYVVVHTDKNEQKFNFKDGVLWISKDLLKVCLTITPQTPGVLMHPIKGK